MSDIEKIDLLKAMIGDSDSDTVLFAYLDMAGRRIISKAYPFDTDITEVPSEYDMLQCEIAAYLLNKRGAEGQTSHSENGITRNYEAASVPSSMLSAVTPRVGVIA